MESRYSASLKQFFKEILKLNLIPQQKINILDIGCSDYSVFEDVNEIEMSVDAIDVNIEKIIAAPPNNKVKYFHDNIVNFHSEDNKRYDIVFDSHALHCIINLEERRIALKNIYNLLNDDGFFLSEMMIIPYQKDLFYHFPGRVVLDAREIESEILSLNFKIRYFMVSPQLYFEDGFGTGQKCELLRIVAQK